MKLLFISAVAVFLLYSATATRNGPTDIIKPPRRLSETLSEIQARPGTAGRIVNIKTENQMNARGWPTASKVTGVSRTPRTSQRKFSNTMTPGNPFIATSGYPKIKKLALKARRKSFAAKFHQARRSFDLGIKPYRHSSQETNHDAIFLEPVLRQESKKGFFSQSFGAHVDPESTSASNDMMGPLIGPLNFPGIGKNVYIRLMVPPDEETASHIMVHLINRGSIEPSSDVYKSVDFELPRNREPVFSGHKSTVLALTRPQKLITSSPLKLRGDRVVDESVDYLDLTPPKPESLEASRVQNHREIPEKMTNHQPAQFGMPSEYLASSNHHQLPIAHRPGENLINLPVYPPLHAEMSKNEMGRDNNEAKASAESQMNTDMLEDTQQSGSIKHTLIFPNYLISPTAWKSIRFSAFPEPEARASRRESPEPVFMEEITPPDLSSYNISMTTESPWGESRSTTVPNNVDDYEVNVNPKSSGSTPATPDDKYIALVPADYPSKHTMTSRTKHTIPKDFRSRKYYRDNPAGEISSTTSNTSSTIDSRISP